MIPFILWKIEFYGVTLKMENLLLNELLGLSAKNSKLDLEIKFNVQN